MARRIDRIILPFLLVLFMAPSTYAAPKPGNVQDIVKKLKDVYNKTASATIKFEQTSGMGTFRGTLTYSGNDKFRLEMPKQTMVSNGQKTWVYVPEKKQVVVSKSVTGSGRLTPGDILTAFPGDYKTELVGEQKVNGRSVWVVRCSPGGGKKVGDVTAATLYIDKSNYRFQQVEIESPSVGNVKLRIVSAQYGSKVAESTFSFVAPKNVRVVDLSN